MTEKRFKIIDKQFISYYGGDGHLISNGNCKFWLWHDESGSQKVCDTLNIIMEENDGLKQALSDEKHLNKLELDQLKEIIGKLSDENGQLRHDATVLIQANTDYRKENEQLKQSEKDCQEWNHKLINENEQLKQKYDNSVMLSAKIQVQNDELRERNNRQAKTIDNLYSLIENEDWKGLTAIIDEMNEAEELNQMEFQTYCGDKR